MKVIDSHVHVGKGVSDNPLQSGVDLENIINIMDECDMERAVIFPHWYPHYKDANKEVYDDFMKVYDDKFIQFIRYRPIGRKVSIFRKSDAHDHGYLDEFFETYKPGGIKLHFSMDGCPSKEVFGKIEPYGLPILVHGGGKIAPPSRIEELVLKNCTCPVIIAHGGAYPVDLGMYRQTKDLMRRYDNVYVDTAYVWIKHILEDFIENYPERVLFGSDYPAVHPLVGIKAIETLDIPESVKRMVLYDNAKELFKL